MYIVLHTKHTLSHISVLKTSNSEAKIGFNHTIKSTHTCITYTLYIVHVYISIYNTILA